MKKLVFVLAVFLWPVLSEAQETYTLNASAAQVADLDGARVSDNRDTCQKYNLTVGGTCTQSALCIAGQAAGGGSCTAAQARNANVRLWPGAQAGREEFLTFGILQPAFQLTKNRTMQSDRQAYCVWFRAQDATTKGNECTKVGAATTCDLCS